MKKSHYDVLLVGAGLFNAVLAWRFIQANKSVLVIDRREHVGGNCYTELNDGIHVHKYGAHIFHTSNELVWNFATIFDKFNNFVNSPIAVDKDGKAYNLPFNMNTFAAMFNVSTPAEARKRIEEEKKEAKLCDPFTSLEDKAISMVGRTIYEHLVKEYTEKQWGRPCSELAPSIINRLPVRFTYDNNYFNDTYQGIPSHGYTKWIWNMMEGADIELGIDYNADRDKWNDMADVVFYSGCVDEYFDYAYGPLEYRSLKFVEKKYNTTNHQGNAVINYTSHNQKYTRSIEHRFFMGKCSAPGTIVSFEYPKKWKRGDEPYYPVNNYANQAKYDQYRDMFPMKVIPVGRLGMYRYYDMDDTILAALNMPIAL